MEYPFVELVSGTNNKNVIKVLNKEVGKYPVFIRLKTQEGFIRIGSLSLKDLACYNLDFRLWKDESTYEDINSNFFKKRIFNDEVF